MKLFSKPYYFALSATVLIGCSTQYQVSTNIDQENFTEYFSPTAVTIYTSEQEISNIFNNLGLVEGESCQAKAHHSEPDLIEARTDARRKAYQLGANGIIFSGCSIIENVQADKHCVKTRVCYGRALQVSK